MNLIVLLITLSQVTPQAKNVGTCAVPVLQSMDYNFPAKAHVRIIDAGNALVREDSVVTATGKSWSLSVDLGTGTYTVKHWYSCAGATNINCQWTQTLNVVTAPPAAKAPLNVR